MNLTQTSYYARKAINVVVFLLLMYLIAFSFRGPITGAINSIIPEKDPANLKFGKLPPLEFIAQPIAGEIQDYEINTPNGRLPTDLPAKAKVFKYNPSFFSFEAAKNAQKTAEILGYSPNDLISDLKSDTLIWRDINYNTTLNINLASQTIDLNAPLNTTILGQSYPLGSINNAIAIADSKKLLTDINKFKDQLYIQGTQQVSLGRYIGNNLVTASTPLEAQVALIDFYRKIEDFPILGPDPKKGLIRMVLGKPSNTTTSLQQNTATTNTSQNLKARTPLLQVYEWGFDTNSDATYPIVPIAIAWRAVTAGNGVIANVTPSNKSPFAEYERTSIQKFFVENIYIAYYENLKPQEYLQPIYVFEGRYSNELGGSGALTIYYPAIDGQHIKGVDDLNQTQQTQ